MHHARLTDVTRTHGRQDLKALFAWSEVGAWGLW